MIKEIDKMRLKGVKESIEYNKTKDFFDGRADKYNENNPYQTVMCQDSNPQLVIDRNAKELEVIKPKLSLNENSRVLDLACGMGRWADAIEENIIEYCGIDFSTELLKIARARNVKKNFNFLEGSIIDLDTVFEDKRDIKYNVVLIMGVLHYINDSDLMQMFEKVEKYSDEKALICIREPIGISERLTLKDFYSEELKKDYSAIYRTREEWIDCFEKTLFAQNFRITDENYLFQGDLNNRKETSQYYFILER